MKTDAKRFTFSERFQLVDWKSHGRSVQFLVILAIAFGLGWGCYNANSIGYLVDVLAMTAGAMVLAFGAQPFLRTK